MTATPPEGRGSGNSRNGHSPKRVTTDVGEVELLVPRDRGGSFEPKTVPKYQRRLDGLSGNVISLYAKGLTTGDIQAHLEEIYDTDISRETISRITDRIVDDMLAWQNRPLDSIYPVLLIDAIVIKVRDSQVANRPVYVAIGVNLEGHRDVLGLWLGPSGGEGAKQWATMLGELKNRGISRCVDCVLRRSQRVLPDAIRTTWPAAEVQTCVVHLVRNSLRYASKKHWGQITKAMRAIYTAPTVAAATDLFAEFSDEWREKYPAMIRSWENSWDEFTPFLAFPTEIRKIIYTTNSIESLELEIQKGSQAPGPFPHRASSHESPLSSRNSEEEEPIQSDRPNQRMETHPQHTYHALRRPHRPTRQMTTRHVIYTKNVTVPSESIDAMSRQNFEDAGPSPETSSENVVNIVFIGGVGTGFSEEKSAMDLAQLLQVLHDAGVDANGYYTTWPSSKDVVVPFSGVGEADARMLACHDSGFWPPRLPLSIPHPEPSCFYEDYAPDLASDLRSSYEGLPGTTILFPHSEGVVATSFAFAEDDQAFTDVFDMVVLMSGAGAVTGGYEGYTDAGLPLVTAYDPHDPVVLNSMTYLPSMGDLESPLDIDGSQPLAIPMAGHSGLFDPENPTSKTLGRATADRLTATNDVVPFDPWTVWAPGADFGYQGMV